MAESFIDRLVRRQNWMDGLGDFLQKVIGAIYKGLGAPGRLLNNLLHGTALLGHPLHPAVTDIPIGAWSVGVVLDYLAVSGHFVPAAAGSVGLLGCSTARTIASTSTSAAAIRLLKGALHRVMVGDLPALLVRQQGKICAIGAVCSHAGGPLDEGTLEKGRVTCPRHGSIIDVGTGSVKGGPATFGQPQLVIREADGRVSAKPAIPLH
jgi:nitrite reductase/ring-hydroxylating ferredoxin subunit